MVVVLAVVFWGVASLAAEPQKGGSPGPTFVDVQRSIAKQRDAADDAAKTVARGGDAAKQVVALLADSSAVVRDRVVKDVIAGCPMKSAAR